MLKTLLKKKYLRRISGVKQEKFEKSVSKLNSAWRRVAEAEASYGPAVWDWGIEGTFAVVVDVLSDVYDTFVFSANI